jgi:hypothetical protein
MIRSGTHALLTVHKKCDSLYGESTDSPSTGNGRNVGTWQQVEEQKKPYLAEKKFYNKKSRACIRFLEKNILQHLLN